MSGTMNKLSLVIPAYNEEESIPVFYEKTCEVLSTMDVETEFLFVDDGSTDNTLGVIEELANRDKRLRFISFSRNFGKEAAILAGIEHCTGDYVAVMDADLQDPPQLLPKMFEMILSGTQIVGTRRVSRKGEPVIRSFFARRFYRLMKKISKTNIVDGARDYQMMTRKVANAIKSLGEYNRFSKGIYEWVGFKKEWIEYENVERAAGESKWSFWGLMLYAIDGIVAFSTAPLVLSSIFGIVMCIVAFIMIIVIIIRTLAFGDETSGWPSMVCIILFIGGLVLSCMGIMGQYLAKTYLETKHRPHYLIDKSNCDLTS